MQVIDQAICHGPTLGADDFDGGLERDGASTFADLVRKGLALMSGSCDQHSFAGQRRWMRGGMIGSGHGPNFRLNWLNGTCLLGYAGIEGLCRNSEGHFRDKMPKIAVDKIEGY